MERGLRGEVGQSTRLNGTFIKEMVGLADGGFAPKGLHPCHSERSEESTFSDDPQILHRPE